MESRKFHRLLLQIDIKHTRKTGENSHHSKTKNISVGGICITTHTTPLKVDDILLLEFSLPGNKEVISAEGRVVWNKKYITGGVTLYDNGIEFLKMNKKFKTMIEDFSIGSINKH